MATMPFSLITKKCGMTRVFTESGESIPVTVLQVDSNRVCQIKTEGQDGYNAVQIAYGQKPLSRVNKPLRGHYQKEKVEPGSGLQEFRLENLEDIVAGQEWKADCFEVGQRVDVTALSKGKGFAGVIKRYNFSMQDATHGNSLAHRAPGSIGQCQTPGRVFKGKKMAGHMGNKQRTVQNLEVVQIDAEKNIILVKGAVPGSVTAKVVISPAVKIKQTKKA